MDHTVLRSHSWSQAREMLRFDGPQKEIHGFVVHVVAKLRIFVNELGFTGKNNQTFYVRS